MFKILVKAKPNAKIQKVELIREPVSLFDGSEKGIDLYKVSIKAQAIDGKANRAIIKALAEHFAVAPSCVVLVSGATAKQKMFEITL